MKNYLPLLFLLMSMSLDISAQNPLSEKQIDSLVKAAMDTFNVAGVAVAVIKDDSIIHSKGYGYKNIDKKEKVDQNTNFAIASNSKAFACAALAILVDEEKIQWTDRVVDHIPEFKMYNSYVTENFNIQDLLTHRSGLGLGIGDLMIFPDGSDFTMRDLLSSFQHFKPESAFRTKFDYDNLLYLVAGELTSRVSGMSWEDFVEQKIFRPIGIESSYTALSKMIDKSNLASPHTVEQGELKALPNYQEMINGAAAGIFANVNDLSKWMKLQLNKGKYGDSLENEVFSKKQHQEMWKIHTSLNARNEERYNSHFAGYGLGWFLKDVRGNMHVSHTGGLPGMLSKTVLIPDQNMGVVVLTNTEPGGAYVFTAVTNAIVDAYIGLEPKDWIHKYNERLQKRKSKSDSIVTAVWETVKKANRKNLDKKNYIGTYKDPWFGKVNVLEKNKKLWFECERQPKLNGEMFYYKANSFAIKWEYQDMKADAFAIFKLDEEGMAEGLRMKGIAPDIDFSFDFEDLNFERIPSEEEE
ncbi:MAG: serine hydrolase [Flavobacteriales bacterium]|nr:serine hydrolase [Flavobacteriales bacterium]